jgi:hypothetical protein
MRDGKIVVINFALREISLLNLVATLAQAHYYRRSFAPPPTPRMHCNLTPPLMHL